MRKAQSCVRIFTWWSPIVSALCAQRAETMGDHQVQDCITRTRTLWGAGLGSRPRHPTRCRAPPAPFFHCVGLSVGWISCISRPTLPRRQLRVVSWVDILLDVICEVERALREGCPRTMTGVSQRWFSGHFRQVFFNTIAL